MDKTPGHYISDLFSEWHHILHPEWEHSSDEWKSFAEDLAEKFIAHVTPQIEAKLVNTVAAWAIKHGMTTGHADTLDDLLKAISWHINEIEAKARAVVVAYLKAACFIKQEDGSVYAYWPCINAIDALASAPPGHACVPVKISDECLKEMLQKAGMWCEEQNPEYESGVIVVGGMSKEDADQINRDGMDELRSQWEDILAARAK